MSRWFKRSVKPMSLDDVRYFFVEKADLLRECTVDQLLYLQKLYPSLSASLIAARARSPGPSSSG